MEQLIGELLITDKGRTETLPPVTKLVHTAISEATPRGIVDDERNNHPYPQVGELVVVNDALLKTWGGEEWSDGTIQTTGPGIDQDSW